jgi:hypothetical protein
MDALTPSTARWNGEEDLALIIGASRHGTKWETIKSCNLTGFALLHRSPKQLKVRYRTLLRQLQSRQKRSQNGRPTRRQQSNRQPKPLLPG